MDLRRVYRLAWVLVASQLRSGRSGSDPTSLWGRPSLLALVDAVALAVVALLADAAANAIARVDAAALAFVAPLLLAFLPLFALGIVLVAGVMFELSTTTRFSTSDAANWLPLSPVEYVVASASAAAYSYSTILAVGLGVGLGLALVTGLVAAFLLAAVLSVLSLLLGGLLIEMLRASTQRLSTVVARRTGRATLVLRILLFLVVILAFQSAFNPIFLLDLLRGYAGIGPYGALVPLLWAPRSVQAFLDGDLLLSGALAALDLLLIGLAVWAAVGLRVRFWVPVAAELRLEEHRYAAPHPLLRRLGLTPREASLVSKDLKGLVRRRELLPILVTPLVIALFSAFSSVGTGGVGPGSALGVGILVAWIPGFFALLLASASFGQERRSIQMLFALPLPPSSVFRAKLAVALLPAVVFGGLFWAIAEGLERLPALGAVVLLAIVLGLAPIGAFLGLGAAARWSDFQERPRPQFVRPLPMLGMLFLGMALDFGIGLPVLLWAIVGAPLGGASLLSVAVPVALLLVLLPVLLVLARRATLRFLAELPV